MYPSQIILLSMGPAIARCTWEGAALRAYSTWLEFALRALRQDLGRRYPRVSLFGVPVAVILVKKLASEVSTAGGLDLLAALATRSAVSGVLEPDTFEIAHPIVMKELIVPLHVNMETPLVPVPVEAEAERTAYIEVDAFVAVDTVHDKPAVLNIVIVEPGLPLFANL